MREIPHWLGPFRDMVVAVVIFLIMKYEIIQFSMQIKGFKPSDSVTSISPEELMIREFILGFMVGLVLPLVVDRLIGSSQGMLAQQHGSPEKQA